MFSPTGCGRGFPRQPGPWHPGPPPPRPYGPQDMWDEMPQHGRGRGQWYPPPRPFPGPDDFYGDEENGRWAPSDLSPQRHRLNEEYDQGPEPWSCYPDDYCGNEKERGWAHNDWSAPCFWGERDDGGPEEHFGEGWQLEMMPPGPNCSAWPEFPNEEQHPPWPPAHWTEKRDCFQHGSRPWGFRGPARGRCQRLRRGHRNLTVVPRSPYPWPRGYRPPSQSSPCSGMSQPVVKDEPKDFDPPQPLPPVTAGVQRTERQEKDMPADTQEVPKCPQANSISKESQGTDSQAVTEAVKAEQAGGAMLVELGATQKPVSSQGPSALKTEPASPEKSSIRTKAEEPCSQSTPVAAAESHPHSPTAPPEPSQGPQCTTEAASAGVPPGAPTEANVQPEEASSYTCTKAEASPRTQHPPGSSEVKPAASGSHQLCSGLPNPSAASTDLRSAAVLARKEKIELSYQQFSLTIAVVATMLLQKEPSMEAALGVALRANLRQGSIHHLQELEDFINTYDSAPPSQGGC